MGWDAKHGGSRFGERNFVPSMGGAGCKAGGSGVGDEGLSGGHSAVPEVAADAPYDFGIGPRPGGIGGIRGGCGVVQKTRRRGPAYDGLVGGPLSDGADRAGQIRERGRGVGAFPEARRASGAGPPFAFRAGPLCRRSGFRDGGMSAHQGRLGGGFGDLQADESAGKRAVCAGGGPFPMG